MGEGGGIDDEAGDGLARLVDPIDQLMLGVALFEIEAEAKLGRQRPALRLDIRQGLVAVDMRLALAEQIQVRPVEDQNCRSHRLAPGRRKMRHCALGLGVMAID